jgi:hypothetical protein
MPIRERINDAMREHASQAQVASPLDASLQAILDAGFVDHDGSVFLASEADSVPHGELLDQTGREALVNHVHVEDRLPQLDGPAVISQASQFARALAERLVSTFPGAEFDVVLAIGDSVTVRFYRRRSNEPPWLASDLESYQGEAVLVLTVD